MRTVSSDFACLRDDVGCIIYGMPTLLKKTIRGKAYYYEVESRRVPGKRYPVLVNQRCLGSAAHVLEILSGARRGQISGTARLAPLGAAAALFNVAERLGLVDL